MKTYGQIAYEAWSEHRGHYITRTWDQLRPHEQSGWEKVGTAVVTEIAEMRGPGLVSSVRTWFGRRL